jgi:hypothetical protein
MKGMIKVDEFIIEESGVHATILVDKETLGSTTAMVMLKPPTGFIMTTDHGCIPDPNYIA